jgi:aspartyl-tRNA(Asn)/glutamyl-tRNA(Gln) amidotransferase subunit A
MGPRDGFVPAWQIGEAVRRGKWSAHDVIEAAFERIERMDGMLNAFTAMSPDQALERAAMIDAKVRSGIDPGRLAGVPLAVKDLEPAAGLPFTSGSRIYAQRVAAEDSVQVARLKAAGAVVIGKTNTPEFGARCYTVNRLHGATGNPWNLSLTPGGSSGGSAAAVASGMVPLATASDGGGSIRIPAAWSGCFGIKPSLGRIPRAHERAPTWGSLSHPGPLAETVRDAARYLDVVAGPHPDDLEALDSAGGRFEAALLGPPLRLRRVAWSQTLGYAEVDAGVAATARQAAEALAGAVGAELVEVAAVFERDPLGVWSTLAAPGDLALLERLAPAERDLVEGAVRKFGGTAMGLSAVDYLEALEGRYQLNRRMSAFFRDHDLLLTPTVAAPPFPKEGPPPTVLNGRNVGPTATIPFTYPFNVTGHPAASIPAGLGPDGMPVGLQVVGPRYDDVLVLRACAALEAARPWPRAG